MIRRQRRGEPVDTADDQRPKQEAGEVQQEAGEGIPTIPCARAWERFSRIGRSSLWFSRVVGNLAGLTWATLGDEPRLPCGGAGRRGTPQPRLGAIRRSILRRTRSRIGDPRTQHHHYQRDDHARPTDRPEVHQHYAVMPGRARRRRIFERPWQACHPEKDAIVDRTTPNATSAGLWIDAGLLPSWGSTPLMRPVSWVSTRMASGIPPRHRGSVRSRAQPRRR